MTEFVIPDVITVDNADSVISGCQTLMRENPRGWFGNPNNGVAFRAAHDIKAGREATQPKPTVGPAQAEARALRATDLRAYRKNEDLQRRELEEIQAEIDGKALEQGPSDKKSPEPAAVGPVAEGAEYFPGLSNAEVAEAVGAFAGLPDVIQNCLAWAATTEQPKFSAATPQHMDNFLALNDGAKDVMRKWGSSAKLKVGAFDARLTPWFQSMSATERKGLRDYFKRMPAAEFASVITKTLGR